LLLEVYHGDQAQPVPLQEITETRPWGSFTVLKDEPDYKLKQLMAKPGNRLSLQRHQHREEHWMVVRGQAEVTLDNQQIRLQPGEYIKIPKHSWHRLANLVAPSEHAEPVEIIELQLGDYFGEDDIERCEDDYGRA
jgi:mannose-1-phosphate guanylyltransferase/mannose-6-phosphate isomerase